MTTITEIAVKTETAGHTLQTYLEYLRDKHAINIHNGSFAVILESSNLPYVYKVWTVDDAFEEWYATCMKYKSNPTLPKYYGRIKNIPNFFIRRDNFNKPIHILKMEKLISLNDCPIKFNTSISEIFENVSSFISGRFPLTYIHDYIVKQKWPTEVADFIDNIYTILTKTKFKFTNDINYTNIMYRPSTGELVLTDPLYDSKHLKVADGKITTMMDDTKLLKGKVKLDKKGKSLIKGFGKNITPA